MIEKARAGDRQAFERFILINQGLVHSVARRLMGRGLDPEDLVSEGQLGLIRAYQLFDMSLGYKFSTYATWWIKQAIHRALDDRSRTIRIPNGVLQTLREWRKASANFELESGRLPTVHELAKKLKLTESKFQIVLTALESQRTISLDAPCGDDDASSFMEMVEMADVCEFDAEAQIDAELFSQDMFRHLSIRQQIVIRARFGFQGEEQTLQAVAAQLGLSRERVRQIEHAALKSLRERCERPPITRVSADKPGDPCTIADSVAAKKRRKRRKREERPLCQCEPSLNASP